MSTAKMPEPPPIRVRKFRRYATVATTVLLLILVWVVWVLWIPDINVPTYPVTATRSPLGGFELDHPTASPPLAFNIGSFKSNLSYDSASNYSGDSNPKGQGASKLHARSIVLLPRTDGVLDRRIAYALFERLQQLPNFDQVRYLPPGESLPAGEPLPDYILEVDVEEFSDKGFLIWHSFDAQIRYTMHHPGMISSSFYFDHLTPPEAMASLDSTLNITATQHGIESATSRYSQLTNQVVDPIVEGIKSHLTAAANGRGFAQPPLPEFLPAYTPLPNLPFLKTYNARLTSTGTQFMRSNLSVWEITPSPPEKTIIDAATADLKAMGWSGRPSSYTPSNHEFRAHSPDSAEELEIAWTTNSIRSKNGHAVPPPACKIAYTRRMSASQIQAALKIFLACNPTEDEVCIYERFFGSQPVIDDYFTKHPPQSDIGITYLANRQISQNHPDEARKIILRGIAFHRLRDPGTDNSESPEGNLLTVAQSLGIKTFPKIPDLGALNASDRLDVPKDLPATRTVELGQSIAIISRATTNDMNVILLTPIIRSGDPANPQFKQLTFKIGWMVFEPKTLNYSSDDQGNPDDQSDPLSLEFMTSTFSTQKTTIQVTSRKVPGTQSFEITVK